MKKTISLACYNRPQYLKRVLSSLRNQIADLSDYELVVSCDNGRDKKTIEVIKMVHDVDFIKTKIIVNNKKLGINRNTFYAINEAYKIADYNLYLEDDIVLSPDALNLFDWYTKQSLDNIATLFLCNLWSKGRSLSGIHKTRSMCAWGFVVSKYQFEKYIEPAWFPKVGCWDNSVARYIRTFEGVYNLYPEISRSTNIGRSGSNMTDEKFKKLMGGHEYYKGDELVGYKVIDK